MIQAIDRLRLIHNEKRKTVDILCSFPLDIPVDELVTWKQLTGDRRLADALAGCDERAWDALPLAAKEMSRLFPDLWALSAGESSKLGPVMTFRRTSVGSCAASSEPAAVALEHEPRRFRQMSISGVTQSKDHTAAVNKV